MRRLQRETLFDCDANRFWEMFFDEEFNRRLYLDTLRFLEIEVIAQTETSRCMRAVPQVDLPGPLMKLFGPRFGYEERGELDRAAGEWRWYAVPSTLADKIETKGVMRISPRGDGGIRRSDEITIEARVFAVGGLIELTSEKQLRALWEKEAPFTERWLADLALR
jgi:hypothetical protein